MFISVNIDMATTDHVDAIDKVLKEYGFASLDEANELCLSKGINVDEIVSAIKLLYSPSSIFSL